MDPIEKVLRDFAAAFSVVPGFKLWARVRANELRKRGEEFEIIMVWGRRRFRVGRLPGAEPYFAIERADGTVERSPWCEQSEGGSQCERMNLPQRLQHLAAFGTPWRRTSSRSPANDPSNPDAAPAPSTAPSSTFECSRPRTRQNLRG